MKKIALLAIALSSVSAFAWEANVKTGFDFYRGQHEVKKIKTDNKVNGNGWTLGAEFIPYNKGRVDLGVGFEYNFGVTKARYSKGTTENSSEENKLHFAPIYALAKVKLHKSEDNNSSIYALARFGGAVVGEKGASKGGVYYGLGLGFNAGHAVVEGLYDGAYTPADKNFHHKVGVRVGFRFGDYKIAKPIVIEEPAPVVVAPVPVVEAPVVEAPKVIETKGLIHASCSSEEKKCIIYGFKVDGRKPNKEEEKNLAEITAQLNDFYKSGTIDIVGHTDSTGSNAYNQKLSVKRATEIKKLLEKHGLKSEYTINSVTGKGETQPIKTNKTKAGRYHNRRVELLFDNIVR